MADPADRDEATTSTGESAGTSRLYRLAWGFYLLLAVGGALWLGGQQGQLPLALFVDPGGWWWDLAIGGGAGAALLALWQMARRILPSARALEQQLAELLTGVDRAELIALALLSGFAEELFFRGAMQSAWGWIPATAVFALLHTGPGRTYRVWTAFAALAGLALAGLMLWRGNLLAPVVAHALVNGVNLGRLGTAQPPRSDRAT